MLTVSARQGISCMAATPHFYPLETSLEQFLKCRAKAVDKLQAAWRPEFPTLLMGAEVYYFSGISHAGGLEPLRIEGTPLLLLEMPLCTWSDRMVAEIKTLQNRSGFTILLAHIERYLHFQRRAVWDELLEAGVLMQCNAKFFLRWNTKHKAMRLFDTGRVHLLGSDCHNIVDRAPCMADALKTMGERRVQVLEKRCQMLSKLEEAIP